MSVTAFNRRRRETGQWPSTLEQGGASEKKQEQCLEGIQEQTQNMNSNAQCVETQYGTTRAKDEAKMFIAQLSVGTKDTKEKRRTIKEK